MIDLSNLEDDSNHVYTDEMIDVALEQQRNNLDNDNREIVWQYFTILLKICDKAYPPQ